MGYQRGRGRRRGLLSGYDETELLQLNALSGSGADNERAEALLDDLFACLPTP